MTYEEARAFINDSNQFGIVPGLDIMTELLRRLGNPEKQLKVIHVAGTNGKGSTSSFITAILATAGYRVGRYLSPAVFSYRERIQISSATNTDKGMELQVEYITKQGVCETVERIQPICQGMVRDGFHHPTAFEIETAMTMLYLAWQQVDFVVLEVGLGGRLDATNVIEKPLCSVITSISMDHMQFLGDTLEKIAKEKAGIIKQRCPVISTIQESGVTKVLEETAKEREATFFIADDKITQRSYSLERTYFELNSNFSYEIHLLGEYQIENAVLAIKVAKVLETMGVVLGEDQIQQGLALATWPGRFDIIRKDPLMIMDGAHNEVAALALQRSINLYFTNRKRIFIIGVLADKDYQSILRYTAPLAHTIITVTPKNDRALSSEELAKEAEKYCENVIAAVDIQQGLRLADQEVGSDGVIVAFGSLSFFGDMMKYMKIRKEGLHDR